MTPNELRTERHRRGITQLTAAQEAGISLAMWSNVERGMKQGYMVADKLTIWMEESRKEEGRK